MSSIEKTIERLNSRPIIIRAIIYPLAYLMLIILVLTLSCLANPLFLLAFLPNHPSELPQSKEIGSVSGLYGPGAYLAWVLCTVSAIIDSRHTKKTPRWLSPDQIASIIYSTASTYWYYGRIVRHRPTMPDLLQDYSAQAGSFVFNVSVFLHVLGVMASIEERRYFWVFLTMWDTWLGLLAPMIGFDLPSTFIHTMVLPIFGAILPFIISQYRPKFYKFTPFPLITFIFLEMVRTQFVTTPLLFMPKSSASLTDLDQLVSLLTGVVIVIYQWELWNLPKSSRRLRARLHQTPVRSNSIQLEANIKEEQDLSSSSKIIKLS